MYQAPNITKEFKKFDLDQEMQWLNYMAKRIKENKAKYDLDRLLDEVRDFNKNIMRRLKYNDMVSKL